MILPRSFYKYFFKVTCLEFNLQRLKYALFINFDFADLFFGILFNSTMTILFDDN